MTELWLERTGIRRYTGRSSRGAEVLIGSVTDEGVFTPGELMKIALGGCGGLTTDEPLRRRLGDDYRAVIRVTGAPDRTRERYPHLGQTLEVDLSGLTSAEVDRLLVVLNRAVEQVCTVGRTLEHGAEVSFDIEGTRDDADPDTPSGGR